MDIPCTYIALYYVRRPCIVLCASSNHHVRSILVNLVKFMFSFSKIAAISRIINLDKFMTRQE